VRFGQLGLARGQTARLSIVAVGAVAQYPPNPCLVSLRFLDANGNAFMGPNGPVAKELPLIPGEAVSLDLPAGVAFGQSQGRRVAFQAAADITSFGDPELTCPNPVATLEIFDVLSGRTEVLCPPGPPTLLIPPGPPDLRLGMMGLARGQTARISIVPVSGDGQVQSCAATLGFVDTAGNPFTDANGNAIATRFDGKTTELDLRGGDAFRGSFAMRRGIRPTVAVAGAVDPELNPCALPLVTVEIFDVLTGRTQVVYPPGPPQ
jgi:hypothetical protein